jgi:hypothetical protein
LSYDFVQLPLKGIEIVKECVFFAGMVIIWLSFSKKSPIQVNVLLDSGFSFIVIGVS